MAAADRAPGWFYDARHQLKRQPVILSAESMKTELMKGKFRFAAGVCLIALKWQRFSFWGARVCLEDVFVRHKRRLKPAAGRKASGGAGGSGHC